MLPCKKKKIILCEAQDIIKRKPEQLMFY